MGRKQIDRTGEKFGKLLILNRTQNQKFACLCECGNTKEVQYYHLKAGYVKSCGCINKSKIEDKYTYSTWNSMVQRCNNPKNTNYKKYGGLGIVICDRWNPTRGGSFANFIEDMGKRPIGMSLNRKESCKLYSKDTCEWATTEAQSFDQKVRKDNTIGISGVRWRSEKGAYEARISKCKKQILLYYGKSLEDAIKARLYAEMEFYPTMFHRKYKHYENQLKELGFEIDKLLKKELK